MLRMSCAQPCTWWCCMIEPVWAPPQKLRTKSLSYVCSGLFCRPILCFSFQLWHSSCFEVKCWFHTFPKRCSHVPMWILILHDNRDCHVNPFQPACFSSSGSDHFYNRKINYQFFSTVFASSVPSCLCFPAFPPSSSRSWVSFEHQFHSCEASSVFPQLFQPVISRLVRHSSSLFLFRWISIQVFRLITFFSLVKVFSLPICLSPFNHSGVQKTSQEICLCSN